MGKQPKTPNTPRRSLFSSRLITFYLIAVSAAVYHIRCTYDSTPPGDDKINDGKPLLMLDLSGFAAQRPVRVQYTDNAGTATLATAAEKTDAAGRMLYPLYLTRGTRTYSLTITVDQNNNGTFGDAGDYSYASGAVAGISADSDIRSIKLAIANFTAL